MFSTQAFFLGRLFCLYLQPSSPARGQILYLPPLAEEMHKSRRMAALQARQLAQQGYAVLQIDLSGCGDSLGLFEEFSYSDWLNDAQQAIHWLQQQNDIPFILWGLRSGANLALDLAPSLPEARLLLWQPIIDGKQYLTQLLRLKIASQLFEDNNSAKLNTNDLLQQLAQGQAIEIGGYLFTPQLAQQLQHIQLSQLQPRNPIHWFEIGNTPSPAVQRVLTQWQTNNPFIQHTLIQAPSFWNSQEIIELPELIEASCGVLS